MKKAIIALVIAFLFLGSSASAQLPLPAGVPRGDVLVIENHYGTHSDPKNFNYKVPGRPGFGASGFSQVCAGFLWYINTTTSELINWLAAAPPEYSEDFKTVKIRIRKGAYWNDGTPFTAHDVVFTIKMEMEKPGFQAHYVWNSWIEDIYAEDDYTVVIKLKKPNPRFHYFLTVIIYGPPGTSGFIIPKHVWEKVDDPLKFKFYPPLCIGPYNLKAVDPAGNWFLWERYEDWWATKLYGIKPSPKYVLYIHHGPDEKKALAIVKHELDALRTLLPEAAEIVIKNNPYIIGWRREPPYAWPFDACIKGIAFNVHVYPYNITEVRKALVFAINFKEIYEAFKGIDGSLPTVSVLPVVRTPVADEAYYKPLIDELVKLGLDRETLWWKYDPEKAEELLKSVGFSRGPDGKWRLPNGEPWTIHITAPSGFEMESQRIGFLVEQQWERFGVNVEVEPVEVGTFAVRRWRSKFEVGTFWPGCSLLIDLAPHIQWWHTKYYDPEAPKQGGWEGYMFPKRDELNKIIDELEMTPPWEKEKILELGRKALLIWAEELPWAGFFPTPFYTFQDTYCWDGWPTYPDNYYMDPVSWWAQHLFVILQLKPTGRCEIKEALTEPGAKPVLPIEKQ